MNIFSAIGRLAGVVFLALALSACEKPDVAVSDLSDSDPVPEVISEPGIEATTAIPAADIAEANVDEAEAESEESVGPDYNLDSEDAMTAVDAIKAEAAAEAAAAK